VRYENLKRMQKLKSSCANIDACVD
jgi:hypothetical protein